ncbi:unnamed protein product [Adineta ricciae]|uniref:N-acetyltransferase domain-containing protein n=1 Tax=Adineta ricciae TaxID=249248 RepID=A0A815SC99_ADIRI|nr:unnamed protein product [Adineta ricciae]CAF1489206.1 unnamed protein product [Adineta ricciae]
MASEANPSPSIIIRSFQASDLAQCQALFSAGHMSYGNAKIYIDHAMRKDISDIDKNYMQVTNGHWWVAVSTEDNRIIGQIAILPLKIGDPSFYKTMSDDECDQTCELIRLVVAPDAQRLGIGKKLISTLFEFARERGFNQVHLTTLTSMDKACAFYERNGFVKGHIEKYSRNDVKVDSSECVILDPNATIPEEDQRQMKMQLDKAAFLYVQHYFRKL